MMPSIALTPRDRRALAFLATSAVLSALVYFWPAASSTPAVAAPADSVSAAEKRLARLRGIAATVPQKQEILDAVRADLGKREAGLIQAETPAQAQAQLVQILRKLCAAETPPIEIRATDLGGISALGDAYGLVSVAIQFDCPIEQLINLLAAVAAQPELITTNELRIMPSGNAKDKTLSVRLAVGAVVPEKLVPRQKKGNGGL